MGTRSVEFSVHKVRSKLLPYYKKMGFSIQKVFADIYIGTYLKKNNAIVAFMKMHSLSGHRMYELMKILLSRRDCVNHVVQLKSHDQWVVKIGSDLAEIVGKWDGKSGLKSITIEGAYDDSCNTYCRTGGVSVSN